MLGMRSMKLTRSQFRSDVHENRARQVDGIADAVTSAIDSGIDQSTDLADTIMPVCNRQHSLRLPMI